MNDHSSEALRDGLDRMVIKVIHHHRFRQTHSKDTSPVNINTYNAPSCAATL